MSEATKKVEEIKEEIKNDVNEEAVNTTEPEVKSEPEAPAVKEPEVKKAVDDISIGTAFKVIARKAVVPILGLGAVIGVACGVCKKKSSEAYDKGYDDGGRDGYDAGYTDGERNAKLMIETTSGNSEPPEETQNE